MSEGSRSSQRGPSSNSHSTGRRGQDHSNTPTTRNIQEASDALQTAYERIREVRRSIVQISRSLPSTLHLEGEPQPLPAPQVNREQQAIGPRHDALLLPGGAAEEMRSESPVSFSRLAQEFDELLEARERDAIPPQETSGATLATSQAVALPRQSANSNRAESNTATTGIGSSRNDVLPPRFSRPPRAAQPWLSADSAATTRGLRVAAREANSTSPPPLLPTRNRLAYLASALNEYQRMLDHQQTMLGGAIENFSPLPRVEPASTTASTATLNRSSLPSSTIASRYRRANNLISAQQSLNTPLNPSNRMSVLPPPPIPRQNDERILTTPGTSGTERDAGSTLPQFRVNADSQPVARTTGDDWTSRDELSQDFSPWFFPALQDHPPSLVPRQDPQNPDTLRTTRPADASATRQRSAASARRGWARLDPDGNEIPWEDEEALERIRREYRLQAQQRARQDPDSHASVPHGRPFYGSVTDSQLSVPSAPRRNPYSSAAEGPLLIDPLPMPLSEMGKKEDFQDEFYPDVIVPVHACLAGR